MNETLLNEMLLQTIQQDRVRSAQRDRRGYQRLPRREEANSARKRAFLPARMRVRHAAGRA